MKNMQLFLLITFIFIMFFSFTNVFSAANWDTYNPFYEKELDYRENYQKDFSSIMDITEALAEDYILSDGVCNYTTKIEWDIDMSLGLAEDWLLVFPSFGADVVNFFDDIYSYISGNPEAIPNYGLYTVEFIDFLPQYEKEFLEETGLTIFFGENKETSKKEMIYVITENQFETVYCAFVTDLKGNILRLYDNYEPHTFEIYKAVDDFDDYEILDRNAPTCGFVDGQFFIKNKRFYPILMNDRVIMDLFWDYEYQKIPNNKVLGMKDFIEKTECTSACPDIYYDANIYTGDGKWPILLDTDDEAGKDNINKMNYSSFPVQDYIKADESLYKVCDNYVVFNGEPIKCSDFYVDGENIFQTLFTILMIAGPIVFIIFNAIEIVKSVLESDAEKMRKMWSNLVKRAIALLLLFLVPLIITLIMSAAGNSKIFSDNVPEVCLDK